MEVDLNNEQQMGFVRAWLGAYLVQPSFREATLHNERALKDRYAIETVIDLMDECLDD